MRVSHIGCTRNIQKNTRNIQNIYNSTVTVRTNDNFKRKDSTRKKERDLRSIFQPQPYVQMWHVVV